MPSQNTIKQYSEDSYYHIYNRGVNRELIFKDGDDYAVFLSILKRYLGSENTFDLKKRLYPRYDKDIELLAFCLMPNHFHMLIYQEEDPLALETFMRSVATTYSVYFNKKYNRVGHVFQGRYKASIIDNEAYLLHISRYIHLNPINYKVYEWSSLPYYLNKKQATWIKPDKITELFSSTKEYIDFTEDYEDHKQELDVVKHMLADV